MVIRKVVIPAAGLGTRLYPATKVQPKEMLPIFSKNINGIPNVKPIVQAVFENLHNVGLREFCFIVGKGKRAIEDHFTPDQNCIKSLQEIGKNGQAVDLDDFYEKLESSTVMWVNQPEPKGFGNAVLMAQPFVQNERCLVHAGDGYLKSEKMDYLQKLIHASEELKADAAFLVIEIDNPTQYGIVEGKEVQINVIRVEAIDEKPEKPKTNLAVMAMYTFSPIIFEALKETVPDKKGETQLTDAIQKLIEWNKEVYAIKLDKTYKRIDIGTPQAYKQALETTYQN